MKVRLKNNNDSDDIPYNTVAGSRSLYWQKNRTCCILGIDSSITSS